MSSFLPNDMNFEKNHESNNIAKSERSVNLKKQKYRNDGMITLIK